MKKLLILLVILLSAAVHEDASAYLNDVVHISETDYDSLPQNVRKPSSRAKQNQEPPPSADNQKREKKESSPEVTWLLKETAGEIKSALAKDFPCLKIFTTGETKKALAALKRMEFVGPKGEKWLQDAKYRDIMDRHEYTTAEEEAAFQKSLQEKLDEFQTLSDAKYNVFVVASVNKLIGVNLRVRALSKFWAKRSGVFYEENKIYPSVEKALADTRRITGELVDAFVSNASDEKSEDNEVCPFRGKVEVKAITKRKQAQEDTYSEYCNGGDRQSRKSQSATSEGDYRWQFNRLGNPDTDGTMKGTVTAKFVYEEVSGCYQCSSGKKGSQSVKSETGLTGAVEGLDTSTWSMKAAKSDNKDATIRLHFSKNGTYKVSVRAVSKEGTKKFTKTVTANGVCAIPNEKPKTEKQTFSMPLERQFGPFSGTVRDKRLKDKQTLSVRTDDLKDEVTEFTIDFDLMRPEGK
ncbi:MAG: hypothetical protein ABIL58_07035 [Pseudomonadota bacterium]